MGLDAITGKLQANLVAVALIFTVHEDEECDARGDVVFGAEVYREWHVRVRHSHEGLDMAIAVPSSVFLEFRVAGAELDGGLDLL